MTEVDPFCLEQFQKQDLLCAAPAAVWQLLEPPSTTGDAAPGEDAGEYPSSSYSSANDLAEQHAVRFFDKQMEQCYCESKCSVPHMVELAKSFAVLSEVERSNAVRAMIFALAAPPGSENELLPGSAPARKIRRRATDASYSTTSYTIRGVRVCRAAFSAVVQLHPDTVNRYARKMTASTSFGIVNGSAKANRKGKPSIQTGVAVAFLRRYGEINAISCPTGRGSSVGDPIHWLASDTTRASVYSAYCEDWNGILEAVEEQTSKRPTEPLLLSSFCKVWKLYLSTLRILRSGSDFCDTCTQLLHLISTTQDVALRASLARSRQQHREEAAQEFKFYKSLTVRTAMYPREGIVHLTFDFAEKILLPHLLRQPGQLHFVTGLKFDFFGVHSSNLDRTFIYGLPEGHWPNNKTANEVGSMLLHCIEQHNEGFPAARTLLLHADNCSGQNKNRFILWLLAFRIIMGLQDSIKLFFLVAGHTKNRCDAAFGFVKRKLKQRNVVSPREMMRVIEDSSKSNKVVCSTQVAWRDWKSFLSRWFTIPSSFRITKYHVFAFEKERRGTVLVKDLTSTESYVEFSLLKRSVDLEALRSSAVYWLSDDHLMDGCVDLNTVPSAQEGDRRSYLKNNVLDR